MTEGNPCGTQVAPLTLTLSPQAGRGNKTQERRLPSTAAGPVNRDSIRGRRRLGWQAQRRADFRAGLASPAYEIGFARSPAGLASPAYEIGFARSPAGLASPAYET